MTTPQRLGELLLREGRVHREAVRRALELQQRVGGRLGTNLLEGGAVDEATLLASLGRQRSMQTVSGVELREVPAEVLRTVPPKLAVRHRIIPVRRQGRTLLIASMDLGDALVEDEIGLLNGCLARTLLGLELRIYEALARYYRVKLPLRFASLSNRLARSGGVGAVDEPGVAPVAAPPPERQTEPPPAPRTRREAPRSAAAVGAAEEPTSEPEAPTTDPVTRPVFIELDDEDMARLYAEGGRGTPEARLAVAAERLQRIEIRDDIADVVLDFCAPYFRRRLLLILRKERIVGWRGDGDGVVEEAVRAIEIPAQQPSVFLGLVQGGSFWLGALPELAANRGLVLGLGGSFPKECVALPIPVRSRVVALLYADNLQDGVAGAPISELKRLVSKAAVAFEVYILRNKIRML